MNTINKMNTRKAFPAMNALKGNRTLFSTMSKRAKYPSIGQTSENLQVMYGGVNGAMYCMDMLTKENLTWEQVVRLVGSGVMSVLRIKNINILGSKAPIKMMNTFDLVTPPVKYDVGLEDFDEYEVARLQELDSIEESELGAFWGVLMRVFISIPPEGGSLDQFNDKRRNNAVKAVMGEAKIFVPNSEFITWNVLRKVEAAFYNCPSARANLIKNIVNTMDKPRSGTQISFFNMFEMLENSGMTAYAVIKEGVEKGEDVLVHFPELFTELEYVEEVIEYLGTIEDKMLPFIKLAVGDGFVPGNPANFAATVAVCKEIVKKFRPTIDGYNTPGASDEMLAKARRLVVEVFGAEIPTPSDTEDD